jgi:hypothetical protein
MLKSEGCQILDRIYESQNSTVYRGIRKQDDRPVIFKMLDRDEAAPAELIHTANIIHKDINPANIKLPSTAQQVLRLAACIGAEFDLNTISGDRKIAESALHSKNQELSDTLQQLEVTQEKLIQSEKNGSFRTTCGRSCSRS